MGKAERAASLTHRRQAITVLRTIQRVRNYLLKNKFDAETFDKLNGKDAAIEQLLGRQILFSMLSDDEINNLRLEIKTKLNDSENEATNALRTSTMEYFSLLKDVVNKSRDVGITNKVISDLSSKNEFAVKAFENFKAGRGVFDCERVMASLEHIDEIADKIELAIPSIQAKLEAEAEEYEEEKHEHEGDLPETGEGTTSTGEGEGSSDNSTLPSEDSGEKPTELPEEEEASKADGDDSAEIADLTFIKAQYSFMDACASLPTVEDKSLESLGFGPDQAVEILKAKEKVDAHYKEALEKLMDVLDGESGTIESLLVGNTKFFRQLDRVTTLVEKMEKYRDIVDASCKYLVAASDEMLKETIKKRW